MKTGARREFLKFAGIGMAGILGLETNATAELSSEASTETVPARNRQGHVIFDVKAFGATGDGETIDTPSINSAIEAAAMAGGGTVHFSAGKYLCYSIRLKSNVSLHLDQGSVIIAANPLPEGQHGGYDEPETSHPWEQYQDFGHNHWHNSLIWGESLHDISVYGPGRIWGRGLSRANGPDDQNPANRRIQGVGNKSISLKNCHNVILRDFQILEGGWFGILATGVDNLIIDGLTIDTNRDGMDIDCCQNVRISNCAVNSPWDDAIVPKSSLALGYERPCKNITITSCFVTGAYKLGSMLDGTWIKWAAEDRVPRMGRIKFGTESNGGFVNTVISDCIFEGCRGLAIESVDGALLEDLVISNITMRDINSSPLFIRLGSRLRGPAKSTQTGAIRRVRINNIVIYNSSPEHGCIISGIPNFLIEDVSISNVYLGHQGGKKQIVLTPAEDESEYPEPNMFGPMPSQAFFIRHARNIDLSDIQVVAGDPDSRPSFILNDVDVVNFFRIRTNEPLGVPKFVLVNVRNFDAGRIKGMKDVEIAETMHKMLEIGSSVPIE